MSDDDSEKAAQKNYERVRNLKKYDPKEFSINFTEALLTNQKFVQSLIEAGNFYTNMHSIHDTCPSGNHQCDYCYSGDTEFEAKYDIVETLKKLWITAYKKTSLQDSDAEEQDDNENDD